jgi:hypothetical protein
MRITSRQLRRLIREELLREANVVGSKDPARAQLEKLNKYIGPNVTVDPASTVAGSSIGINWMKEDTSSVVGESDIANSVVGDNSKIENSQVEETVVSDGSTITRSKLRFAGMIMNCKISGSKLVMTPEINALRRHITNSTITDSFTIDSNINTCTISGGAKIRNCSVSHSTLQSTETINDAADDPQGAYLVIEDVTSKGGVYKRTRTDKAMKIKNAQVSFAEIVDSNIEGQSAGSVKILGDRSAAPYIALASITGNAKVTGKAKVIGLTSDDQSYAQPAAVRDNAEVSGNAIVSGQVTGNARVSGNAEVHGLAHIKGDCVVTGTARMISGVFTAGTYDSGTHEGGDGLVTTVLGSLGL